MIDLLGHLYEHQKGLKPNLLGKRLQSKRGCIQGVITPFITVYKPDNTFHHFITAYRPLIAVLERAKFKSGL